MNKPPERLRIIKDDMGNIFLDSKTPYDLKQINKTYPDKPYTEHFYTLEKEPMQKKTENLTTEEAWAAMARGECVGTKVAIFSILNNGLNYWDNICWVPTSTLATGPYSIVPDPSKPKEVEGDD